MVEDKRDKQLIKNIAVMVEHETGCSWYASDADVCSCNAEKKARKILNYLRTEHVYEAEHDAELDLTRVTRKGRKNDLKL